MSMTTFLAKSFAAAALILPLTAESAPPASSQGRALTEGENSLLAMFGPEMNVKPVQLHAGPVKPFPGGRVAGETFDTHTIAIYGHPFLSLDYSKEKDAYNWGVFFHENTHIWQFQTG